MAKAEFVDEPKVGLTLTMEEAKWLRDDLGEHSGLNPSYDIYSALLSLLGRS